MIAGAKYIQRKYFHTPKMATAAMRAVQTTTLRANSAQIRRLTLRLRTTGARPTKVRRKMNGE